MSGDPEVRAALRAWLEDLAAFGIDDLSLPGGVPVADAVVPAPASSAVTPAAADPATGEPARTAGDRQALLEQLAGQAEACTRCELHGTRNRVVPGQGHAEARFMFVGEAPGAEEDRQGLAFVGRAGQLLTKMILAMGFQREDVFIANVLKCRPPGNRDPRPEEAALCSPFLRRQLDIIGPGMIVALGGHAAKTLLDTTASVGRLRGTVHRYHETPLVVTYHPAYLLRNPADKRKAWEDLQFAMAHLGLSPPARPGPRSDPA